WNIAVTHLKSWLAHFDPTPMSAKTVSDQPRSRLTEACKARAAPLMCRYMDGRSAAIAVNDLNMRSRRCERLSTLTASPQVNVSTWISSCMRVESEPNVNTLKGFAESSGDDREAKIASTTRINHNTSSGRNGLRCGTCSDAQIRS